ncbi:MAG TPA: hypothetical protein VGF60_17350 [Xanthobacteraceae bacterium]
MAGKAGLTLAIMALQCAVALPLSAQQDQASGSGSSGTSATSFRGAANSSVEPTASSSENAASFSSAPSAARTVILPNGRRVSISDSTVIVCDALDAPFPDAVDVCSLR